MYDDEGENKKFLVKWIIFGIVCLALGILVAFLIFHNRQPTPIPPDQAPVLNTNVQQN